MINRYSKVAPKSDMIFLERLGEKLRGRSFLHVNSTRLGGGVAEILHRMIPLLQSLGIDARWEIVEGDDGFYDMTKRLHNALQGGAVNISDAMWKKHEEVNAEAAAKLDLDADAVLIHDPQPAPLIRYRKKGVWLWRCHIDLSGPDRDAWQRLSAYCGGYDASIFSVAKFARALGMDEFIVPPSIDPLSDKNIEMPDAEINATLEKFKIPPDRPMILQVSRFDRFKDPIGVIKSYRLVKKYNDCILVLAGSPATDDPEGAAVLDEVREYAAGDPDVFVLMLPAFSDKHINALQRAASVVMQKSLKEGFGLTVSESMWKGKPVIGGAVGGIPLQIIHGVTGFLVHSAEGAAFRARQLLNYPEMANRMGTSAREHVRNNFLLTRQIKDYLTVWYLMENKGMETVELS